MPTARERALCGIEENDATQLELIPLAIGRITLRPPVQIPDTPLGTRMVGELASFGIKGERLQARLHGNAAADWPVISPDGTILTVDVRATLETHDGALLYVQYGGRINVAAQPVVAYTTPQFDTGDERYSWLTRLQLVGTGVFDDTGGIDYAFYELR